MKKRQSKKKDTEIIAAMFVPLLGGYAPWDALYGKSYEERLEIAKKTMAKTGEMKVLRDIIKKKGE